MRWLTFIITCLIPFLAAVPRFDPTALLQAVLVPADAAVGSIIYRLRASDPQFSYPLFFTLQDKPTIVSIDNLNCTRLNSICQANVVLRRRLEPLRFYDFIVEVQNQRGESVTLECSFRATNATTPIAEIFPGAPTLLMISENARRNTELGTIIAKGNLARPNGVLLELWGSPQFGLHQRLITSRDAQGTILLLGQLDYEERTVHHLMITANDPWTETEKDTRNIATWPLLVAVLDEQDTPPIFTLAPPTTTLSPSLKPGDLILRVHAEDGDRGQPRDVRYGLVPEGNPFTTFFNMSEETGELRLVRPLSDILAISHTNQPILLTVVADEVRSNPLEAPAQSSTVRLALIPPSISAGSPTFGAIEYNAILDENSPIGTVLDLPQAEVFTQPGDLVTLDLVNNNETFEISPTVVQGQSSFQIKVHDPKLLDYELWNSVECYIVAKELNTGNFTARTKLRVLLNDLNDNPPTFSQAEYRGSVQEHATPGTVLVRVEATDIDREPGNKIRYTRLRGSGSEFFELNPISGLITVASSHDLDAETTPTLSFSVEAADEDGKGQTATATIVVELIDINDEVPEFERNIYEFILNNKKNAFTTSAFIKAIDKDISAPNNEVHYELITPVDNLILDENTGELIVQDTWKQDDVVLIRARAWDGGVPRLSSECEIRIYPPDGHSRRMVFIVPGNDPDREEVKKTLRALTGGRVIIHEIRPYTGYEPDATDIARGSSSEKSVVVATVTYANDGVVDVNRIQEILDRERNVKHHDTTEQVKETRTGSSILWLLILLILLALLAAIVLILCCICQGCPLYVPPKRQKIASSEVRKLVRGSGQGRESKSVQVAEWFGRREAWTPEHEIESLRRHEYERGSDKAEARRTIHRQAPIQREPSREQLYIREGNTDILRLVTRGSERPVTLVADNNYVDSGKEILMRRFMDQQQDSEIVKSQVLLPNAVNKLQTEHELLEASLRQQNALLRQILSDRERDLKLETQSLPAGTQTDQDAGTQTESYYFRPPRRRARSDNDASDSDDEYTVITRRVRKKGSNRTHHHIRRKIKTPIQEESDEIVEIVEKQKSTPLIKQTKTSAMRQKRATSETRSKSSRSSGIKQEVLREISASLERSDSSSEEKQKLQDIYSEDSLDYEDEAPRSIEKKYRYHSESDLRAVVPPQKISISKSQSQADLTKMSTRISTAPASKPPAAKPPNKKGIPRYMEWYKGSKKDDGKSINKKPEIKKKPEDKKEVKTKKKPPKTAEIVKEDEVVKEVVKKVTKSMKSTAGGQKAESKQGGPGPEHPLLQHSEHRYEPQYYGAKKIETIEDADSGIALTRPAMAQKKSVFTIAYDDMHTSQLRPDSSTSPL